MDRRTNSQYFNQWILIDNHFPSSRGGNFSFHSGNVPAGYYRTRYKWPKWMFDDKSCIVVSLRCNCTTRLHENSVRDTVVRPRSVSNFRKYRRDLCFQRIYSWSRFVRFNFDHSVISNYLSNHRTGLPTFVARSFFLLVLCSIPIHRSFYCCLHMDIRILCSRHNRGRTKRSLRNHPRSDESNND